MSTPVRVGHHDDWPTLGWTAIDWIEAYLCHGPGDVQGEPFDDLDLDEVQLLCDLYRLYPRGHRRAGRRVVSDGTYSRPKGSRKSEIAGAIVCFEALGPSRFDGWYGGEPVGRPVKAPFIRCLATEEGQSGHTYDNVTVMLDWAAERNPDVFAGVDLGRSPQGSTRVFLPGGGEIRPSTASSAAKDGGKETFALFDELHLYILAALRAMRRTVKRNLMKRKAAEPWALNTTTAYRPGQGSDAEAIHQRADAVVEGRVKRPAVGFYFNHREGADVEDWDDDGQVLAALRTAYGEKAAWMDLERILAEEIRDPEAEEADSRRYFLNQVHKTGEDAFDVVRWAELAQPDLEVPDGDLVVVGFDGARFEDSTALLGTHVEAGHQWVIGIWEKPFDVGDWEVDEAEVEAAVEETFDRWRVWRLYADPPWWESAVDRWAGRWGDRVVRWWTNRDKAMAYAVKAYVTAQRAGELSQDGDSRFARHIGNARRRDTRVKDEEGRPLWTIRKEHPRSAKKIDAAMAGCLSWDARGDCIAAGELAKAKRRRRVVAF